MPGLIVRGQEVSVPGHLVVNFHDDNRLRLRMGQDGRRRRHEAGEPRVQMVVEHTTRGIPGGRDQRPQLILPGKGPSTDGGARVNSFWSRDPKCSGAHLVVDHDSVIYCLADIVEETTFHATTVNDISVGIETVQGGRAELYEGQVEATVALTNTLTEILGIQRQIPAPYKGRPVKRLSLGGRDFYGVIGHRDQTANRGRGDPGDYVMDQLALSGYERFDLDQEADRAAWRARQEWLGVAAGARDGICGPRTTAALKAAGFRHGLWALPPAERTDT